MVSCHFTHPVLLQVGYACGSLFVGGYCCVCLSTGVECRVLPKIYTYARSFPNFAVMCMLKREVKYDIVSLTHQCFDLTSAKTMPSRRTKPAKRTTPPRRKTRARRTAPAIFPLPALSFALIEKQKTPNLDANNKFAMLTWTLFPSFGSAALGEIKYRNVDLLYPYYSLHICSTGAVR